MSLIAPQVRSVTPTTLASAAASHSHRFPRRTGQLTPLDMQTLGFEVLGEIDHWFLEVVLPDGWYKERDRGHLGWWLVNDHLDRLRCLCMEGHPNWPTIVADWQRRYSYDVQWHPRDPCRQRWIILDGGDVIHESEWCVGRQERLAQFTMGNVRKAVAFLKANFPQWRSLHAYW